jgi:hypothetical protein
MEDHGIPAVEESAEGYEAVGMAEREDSQGHFGCCSCGEPVEGYGLEGVGCYVFMGDLGEFLVALLVVTSQLPAGEHTWYPDVPLVGHRYATRCLLSPSCRATLSTGGRLSPSAISWDTETGCA